MLKGLYWVQGLTGKSISWALEEILVWFNKQIITTEGLPVCVRESASGWKRTEWLGVCSTSQGSGWWGLLEEGLKVEIFVSNNGERDREGPSRTRVESE